MITLPTRKSTKLSHLARTPKDYWGDGFYRTHVKKAYRVYVARQFERVHALISSRVGVCESPLEAAFFAWWIITCDAISSLELIPQQRVQVSSSQRYRMDFVCQPRPTGLYKALIGDVDAPKVAIELDGHDYHERTPAQVTGRNRRDRALNLAGWTVFHVSGKEFHDNPLMTTIGIHEDAERLFQQVMHQRLLTA